MTKNYWVVRLGKGNVFAEEAHNGNYIMIGWLPDIDLKDLTGLEQDEFLKKIRELLEKEYPDETEKWYGGIARQIFKFVALAKPGDVVMSPANSEGLKYFGIIKSDYYYEKDSNTKNHRRDIEWISEIDKDQFSEALRNSSGAMMTLFSVSKYADEIESLLSGKKIGMTPDEHVEDIRDFGMESHLEDFIVENWDKLSVFKNYEIYKEDGVEVGQQYVTPIGRIDVLAKSKDGKEWLIIELKKGKSSDDVVGQILRYIGWVTKNETEMGEKVRAIIISGEKDEKLSYSLETLDNVEHMTYEVNFNLKSS